MATATEKPHTIGERIRFYREAQGLNRHELAIRAGVSHTHIAALENDEHSPSVDVLDKIAGGLRVHRMILEGFDVDTRLDPDVHKFSIELQELERNERTLFYETMRYVRGFGHAMKFAAS